MESINLVNTALLLGALLVLTGIFSSLIASRFSAPLLLIFLAIGMLAGEDGIGGFVFDDYKAAYLVGSFSLAVILFDGGMRTRISTFRGVLAPSMTLATLGVFLTAALLAIPAMYLFGLSPMEGMLLGAVVASTDAAAVFFLLHAGGLQLRHKVGSTLEIESGTNDPIAVFLTLVLVQMILSGSDPSVSLLGVLAQQAFLGAAFGWAGGHAALWLLNRVNLPSGLHPLFVVAFAVLIFATTAKLNGSGFLAVYIAGLVLGNNPVRAFPSIIKFHDAMTWLAQIVMFIVLGMLVTPTTLLLYAVPAVLFAFFLMFIARPLAVWLCLIPFKFSGTEKLFISWVGLRGAVSIFLAAIPMLTQLPHAEIYFNVAFFVVLVSLIVQGWSINFSARRLKLALSRTAARVNRIELDLPGQIAYELVGYNIAPDSEILSHGAVPHWATLNMVVRGEKILKGHEVGTLRSGDFAYFLVRPEQAHRMDKLFVSSDDLAVGARSIYRKLRVQPDETLGELSKHYGLKINAEDKNKSVSTLFAERIAPEQLCSGSKISVDIGILVAREIEEGVVKRADLLIESVPDPKLSHFRFPKYALSSLVLAVREFKALLKKRNGS